MTGLPEERLRQVRAIAERVARSHGLELFDLQLRRESIGWVLRVIIDRPAPPAAAPRQTPVPARPDRGGPTEDGVGVDDCRRVSNDLSAVLDVEDVLSDEVFGHPYTLEVSSPGLDRPLRDADDYRRFTGRLAKIVVSQPVDGRTQFKGRLAGVGDEGVLLVEGGRTHHIPLGLVTRARLEVEF